MAWCHDPVSCVRHQCISLSIAAYFTCLLNFSCGQYFADEITVTVFEKHQIHWTFLTARPKGLMRDLTNLNRIHKHRGEAMYISLIGFQ